MYPFCRVNPLTGSVVLTAMLAVFSAAAPADLAGKWLGTIESDRGAMQIGLELVEKEGKLEGALLTAHGDWPVTSVSEKDGLWTVVFKTEGGEGRMAGRIKDGTFAGKWDNAPMAVGTFSLTRARKRS